MVKSGPAVTATLSADDWVQAGFRVLAEGGVKALTIDRLCRQLGVTKGSFYWHFASTKEFRRALIDTWGAVRDQDRGDFDRLVALAPRARLTKMMAWLVGPRHWMLERAMREWARSEDAVAQAVRASDRRVLEAVRQAFTEAGFGCADAELRASAMFAAGVGFLHLSESRPNSVAIARRDDFLELLLRR